MLVVIFEVVMKEDKMSGYLELADKLKAFLNDKGIISSELFTSIVNERKRLSLHMWESEEAIDKWRNQVEHRLRQKVGHNSVFESFRITVANSIRSYPDTD